MVVVKFDMLTTPRFTLFVFARDLWCGQHVEFHHHHARTGGTVNPGNDCLHSVADHRGSRQLRTWSHTHCRGGAKVFPTMARATHPHDLPVWTHAPDCNGDGICSWRDSGAGTLLCCCRLLPRRYY